jgi:hypothetical protein
MRDITDQLTKLQEHLDSQFPSVTAAEAHARVTQIGTPVARSAVWRRAGAFALGFVVLLSIGLVLLVMRPTSTPAPFGPADQPAATVASPPSTPEPSPTVAVVPTEPATPPETAPVAAPSPQPSDTTATLTPTSEPERPEIVTDELVLRAIEGIAEVHGLMTDLDAQLAQLWAALEDPTTNIGGRGWAEGCCSEQLAAVPPLIQTIKDCVPALEYGFAWVPCSIPRAISNHIQAVADAVVGFASATNKAEARKHLAPSGIDQPARSSRLRK